MKANPGGVGSTGTAEGEAGHFRDVAAALAEARRLGVDRLDAQLLLAHRLRVNRSWLIANADAPLDPAIATAYRADLAARADEVPLAYLLGEREFHGLRLRVGPAVLVPRPETEGLVDWALQLLADTRAARVLDLGTGSGAIAITIAHHRPDLCVTATDVSQEALAVAQRNALEHGVAVRWRRGSWWQAVLGERFDLVLSNPPYIAPGDPHLSALRHEPPSALVAADEGLASLRAVIEDARQQMAPGGWLLLEHGSTQGPAVRESLGAQGFEAIETRRDLAGLERTSGARAPAAVRGENPATRPAAGLAV